MKCLCNTVFFSGRRPSMSLSILVKQKYFRIHIREYCASISSLCPSSPAGEEQVVRSSVQVTQAVEQLLLLQERLIVGRKVQAVQLLLRLRTGDAEGKVDKNDVEAILSCSESNFEWICIDMKI